MRLPFPEIGAVTTPIASVFPVWIDAPWYGHLIVAALGPLAFIVNRCLISLLAWKALDKVDSSKVADLMVTVTGLPAPTAQVRGNKGRPGAPDAGAGGAF